MNQTMKKAFLGAAVYLLLLAYAAVAYEFKQENDSSSAEPPAFEPAGDIDQIYFKEPSGIVFHRERGTLFVVGDEGDICEIQRDGTPLKEERIRNADFEGITYNPATGLLYIAVEGEDKIIEVDPDTFFILREFPIERTYKDKLVLKAGGNGIEGIAFIPDKNHPEGGTFYVTNQSFDLKDKEDPSAVFEVKLPLKSDSTRYGEIMRFFQIGVIDLSAVSYDLKYDKLYVVSDETDELLEITRGGKVLERTPLPGTDDEDIAIDDDGFVYIAQDRGGIVKYRWNR